MATVYLGRLFGEIGFTRVVAVKQLHAHFKRDAAAASMFLDEARLVGRIRHPNVVPTIDVVLEGDELFIVMEYVEGSSLATLLRARTRRDALMPVPIAASIASGMLQGVHAAHEAIDDDGKSLGIVHRDVSPQNVLVGIDGVARVLDFGVAKAAAQAHVTNHGDLRGKLAYMSPEQARGGDVDRSTDIFAAGIVFWEMLTSRRLFFGEGTGEIMARVLSSPIPPPSEHNPEVSPELDALVLKALERSRAARFSNAVEMAAALEQVILPATTRRVGEWVREVTATEIATRAELVHSVELAAMTETVTTNASTVTARAAAARGLPDRRAATFMLVSAVCASTAVVTGLALHHRRPAPPAVIHSPPSALSATPDPPAAPSTAPESLALVAAAPSQPAPEPTSAVSAYSAAAASAPRAVPARELRPPRRKPAPAPASSKPLYSRY
jgi:serine/threonine-protein kinase